MLKPDRETGSIGGVPHLGLLVALALLVNLGVAHAISAEAPPGGVSPRAGKLVIDPEHPQWLRRGGAGHVFICGPGDPEGSYGRDYELTG